MAVNVIEIGSIPVKYFQFECSHIVSIKGALKKYSCDTIFVIKSTSNKCKYSNHYLFPSTYECQCPNCKNILSKSTPKEVNIEDIKTVRIQGDYLVIKDQMTIDMLVRYIVKCPNCNSKLDARIDAFKSRGSKTYGMVYMIQCPNPKCKGDINMYGYREETKSN